MRIVTPEEAEQANFVVCIRKDDPTTFADNLEGTCAWCGAEVIFRPHAPVTPPRICPPPVFCTGWRPILNE